MSTPADSSAPALPPAPPADRLTQLEQRLARIETHLGLAPLAANDAATTDASPALAPPFPAPAATTDEFEFEVGQNWFARVGILALAAGGGFMLSLPYPGLPAPVPSLTGFVAVAILFTMAHVGRQSFALVSAYLRGAGMALLTFATLRLFFFGAEHVLRADSLTGRLLLVLVAVFNLALAWRRRSAGLMALACVLATTAPLAVGSAGFVLGALVALALVTVAAGQRGRWPAFGFLGIGLTCVTYVCWAIGNPFLGGAYRWTADPRLAPGVVLVLIVIFGAAPLWRRTDEADTPLGSAAALLNCALGYGTFLVHTAAAFGPVFASAQLGAAAVFLVLAAAFWLRARSQVATFLYAMTGSAALSMAIIKTAPVPEVFVWLSLQSVVVVTAAIWFRSRFIVVANFLIYVAVVLGYVVLNERETGISIGFGVVALVSARILNWKKHRLELKTELMRNAYLLSAFIVFPYALHHLVAARYVGLAWIGLAVIYYVLNFAIQNQKYRWMGHATLLLTAIYLVVAGGRQLEPAWRVASFLALGTVLLVVSLAFTRARRRPPAP